MKPRGVLLIELKSLYQNAWCVTELLVTTSRVIFHTCLRNLISLFLVPSECLSSILRPCSVTREEDKGGQGRTGEGYLDTVTQLKLSPQSPNTQEFLESFF